MLSHGAVSLVKFSITLKKINTIRDIKFIDWEKKIILAQSVWENNFSSGGAKNERSCCKINLKMYEKGEVTLLRFCKGGKTCSWITEAVSEGGQLFPYFQIWWGNYLGCSRPVIPREIDMIIIYSIVQNCIKKYLEIFFFTQESYHDFEVNILVLGY